MKDYFTESFLPHQGKAAGMIFLTVAIVSMIVCTYMPDWIGGADISFTQKMEWCGWAVAFALIMITYSKEKIEDERVMQIRYVALRLTLLLATVSCCALGIRNVFQADSFLFMPVVVVGALHAIYLLLFYMGLWTDHPDFYPLGEKQVGDVPQGRGFLWGILMVSIGLAVIYFFSPV
ncbi:MAG: hypothetical protein AAFR59_08575 [Bacteroidota bacterium]